jgi:hypothetical protein
MFVPSLNISTFKTGHQWLVSINPNYSGVIDQEDCSSKPAQAKSKILSPKQPEQIGLEA